MKNILFLVARAWEYELFQRKIKKWKPEDIPFKPCVMCACILSFIKIKSYN